MTHRTACWRDAIDDPWMQIAALSASSERAPQLFRTAAAFTDKQTGARAAFFRQIVGGHRRDGGRPPRFGRC